MFKSKIKSICFFVFTVVLFHQVALAATMCLRDSASKKLELPVSYYYKTLPVSVDNSEHPYFRPIFQQTGNSCFFASSISYLFTYEINRLRNLEANTTNTQYPTHFCYNFYNDGVDYGGASFEDIWNFLKEIGTPSVSEYGGMAPFGFRRWVSGYDYYYNAMGNRLSQYYEINVGTVDGMQTLKHWLNDHLEESDFGGLAVFWSGGWSNQSYNMRTLPAGTPEAGKRVITQFGHTANLQYDHATVIVGYNDSIRYDYNNDGLFTNDLDINDDGTVDMRDWEVGGVIMANSFGTSWANNGKVYVMYKLLAETEENDGIWRNTVYVVNAKESYDPLLTMKLTVKHTSRNKLNIDVGISRDINSDHPEYTKSYPILNYQGGDLYMQGVTSEVYKTIEIGLDLTDLLNHVNTDSLFKVFLIIEEYDPGNAGSGEIVSYSIIDYSNGEEETVYPEANIPLVENGVTCIAINKSMEYESVQITTNELPDAVQNQPYNYQLSASGGAEPYSWEMVHSYTFSEEDYNFQEIDGNRLELDHADYGITNQMLDFDFPFYGNNYSEVYLTSDGSLLFNPGYQYINYPPFFERNVNISPFSCDLLIIQEEGDGIWYSGNADSAQFIWKAHPFNQQNTAIEFSLTLFPSGDIEFNYGNSSITGIDWLAGISNGNNSDFIYTHEFDQSQLPQNIKIDIEKEALPEGITLLDDGILNGICPDSDSSCDFKVRVTDNLRIVDEKILTLSCDALNIDEENQISSFLLFQNYPNPFNPETNIKFHLSKNTSVKIYIYNALGQKIYILVDTNLNAGQHQITWNARDDSGNLMPSGIYFYRLETPEGSFQKKMLLLR